MDARARRRVGCGACNPSVGAELADPARHNRGAVRRRLRDRHSGAHLRRRDGPALGPAGHRRKQARTCWHCRCRQSGAGRLHADGDVERAHRGRPGREGRAIRSGEGFRRHHPAWLRAAVPHRPSGRSREDPQGGHRPRQDAARQAKLLLAGPRQHHVHRRRAVPQALRASISSMCRSAARPTR